MTNYSLSTLKKTPTNPKNASEKYYPIYHCKVKIDELVFEHNNHCSPTMKDNFRKLTYSDKHSLAKTAKKRVESGVKELQNIIKKSKDQISKYQYFKAVIQASKLAIKKNNCSIFAREEDKKAAEGLQVRGIFLDIVNYHKDYYYINAPQIPLHMYYGFGVGKPSMQMNIQQILNMTETNEFQHKCGDFTEDKCGGMVGSQAIDNFDCNSENYNMDNFNSNSENYNMDNFNSNSENNNMDMSSCKDNSENNNMDNMNSNSENNNMDMSSCKDNSKVNENKLEL